MGIVFRQSALTSIISYAGVAIGYLNLLYLYPKMLEPDQIGLLRIVQDSAILLAPFATIGMVHSVLRFFPQYAKSESNAKSFVGLIVILSLVGYGAFLLIFTLFEGSIMGFFKDNAYAVVDYKNLVLQLTLILVLLSIFEQFAKASFAIALPSFLREVLLRLLQSLIVILYFYSILTFDQLVVTSVIVYVVCLAILLYFLYRRKFGISFRNLLSFPVKPILSYGLISFVSASAMILVGKMDSIMVTGFLGLSAVAVYTTTYYMATVIEVPKRAITLTTTVLMARAFEDNNHKQIQSLYYKASINQLIVGGLLMIGVWANLDNIFDMMPKGEFYRTGSIVVVWVGIGKLIDMGFGPSSEVIGLSKYYWFNLVCITILAVLVIGTNYLFIPEYGIVGAAYGSVVALGLFNLVKYIFVWVKLKMQPFSIQTAKVCCIIAAVVLLNLVLPDLDNALLDLTYRSFIITIAYTALIVLSQSSEDINKVLKKAVHEVLARLKK
jgi:O-antigen/teichoic acid export membrane protein